MDEQEMGPGPTQRAFEAVRKNLSWSEIADAERIERLRTVLKEQQERNARLAREILELRQIVFNHRHDGATVLIPVGSVNNFALQGQVLKAPPGQEWF